MVACVLLQWRSGINDATDHRALYLRVQPWVGWSGSSSGRGPQENTLLLLLDSTVFVGSISQGIIQCLTTPTHLPMSGKSGFMGGRKMHGARGSRVGAGC